MNRVILTRTVLIPLTFLVALGATVTDSHAVRAEEAFRLGIMQDQKGEAAKYAALVDYLKGKGVTVEIVGMQNYSDAAKQFAEGKVDGMFSGSAIAGTMILKQLADPVVRPLGENGISTYSAVVLAKKGAGKFEGNPDYFEGKKILTCSLASSGEFYFRALFKGKPIKGTLLKAASHGAAIDALAKGAADVAIVKNRVWDSIKQKDAAAEEKKYGDLEMIGGDSGENPDNTLIVAKRLSTEVKTKVKDSLLALEGDTSAEAKKAKETLKIQKYIETKTDDFKHTLAMLKDAGVDEKFDFVYKD